MIDPIRTALLLVCSSFLLDAGGQGDPSKSSVTVTIDAGKGVLVAGQPFPVKVTFTNGSGARVKLDAAAARGVGLRIRGAESTPGATTKLPDAKAAIEAAGSDGEAPYEIPPGGSLVANVDASPSFGKLAGQIDVADVFFENGPLKSATTERVEVVEDLTKTRVVLETNKGVIKLSLDPVHAPLAARNFVRHVVKGTYDGTLFHRVIPGFMAQGGDPNSKDADPSNDGQGGAPYNGRPLHGEMTNDVKHERGTLSMARNGDPALGALQAGLMQPTNQAQGQARMALAELMQAGVLTDRQPYLDSSGSQFFICFAPAAHLDGHYTAFGKLVEGDDVLRKLEGAGSPTGKTSEPLKIEKAHLDRG
ncbi:MAG TPA: peptidylprolyl isomerase [Planctomycetota bacterium]|nr:peptidylprolyl isomerase [Planctomycetota bacterium]